MSVRKAGLGFILVTLFLDILGIGLIIPIAPRLVAEYVSGESEASRWFGYFAAVYALMQFAFSPLLGSLSDRFGRRTVLLTSLTGQGLDYVLLAFAPSLGWLFVGRVVAGITGASIGTAMAYIADVSPPEKRSQNFGLVGMAFGLGFVAGPALGGILGNVGLRVPFLVAAGLTLANALYGYFVLPESLAPENRRPFELRRANPFGTLAALARYPVVLGLSSSIFAFHLAQRMLESTWVLYTSHRYAWDVGATGLSLAFVGIGAAVVQGGLVRRILPVLGEQRALVVGVLIGAVAFALYASVPQGWMIYVVLPFGSLAGIGGPALQGLLSSSVAPNEQGMLQGGMASLVSVTQIIGPVIATSLFGYFISDAAPVKIPGIALYAGSGLLVLAAVLARRAFVGMGAAAASTSSVAPGH